MGLGRGDEVSGHIYYNLYFPEYYPNPLCVFVQLTCLSEHLHVAQHGRLTFLHEQFLATQPFVHPQNTISLHAFGIGGSVVSTGLSAPSTDSQPEEVGDGKTGIGTFACLHSKV